ncbi:hypothetical protein BDP27DRAFT_372006 [Rhodocollybia butyracea]|uniref:Uncharacterized protein n=1 Tax=Rhodocollybia butyracea TaxID=206335 RepID=A0A9P5Q2K0_9AGAR|nr:hypothetical protein BDP27DRAFT_372006 [Rhodocollybia butyracea]
MSLVKGDQIFPDIAKAERHSPLLSEAQEEKPMIQDDRMIYSTYQESLHALAYPAGPERAGDLFHGLPDEKQQNLGSKGGFLVDYLEDHSGGHYPVVNQAQGQFRSKNEGPSTASFLANMPPLSFIASSSSLPTSSLPGGTQMPEIWRTEGGFSKEG